MATYGQEERVVRAKPEDAILTLWKMGNGFLLYRPRHVYAESPSLIFSIPMDRLSCLNLKVYKEKTKGSPSEIQQKPSWGERRAKALETVTSKGFTGKRQWSPGLKGGLWRGSRESAERTSQLRLEDHWVCQTKVLNGNPAKKPSQDLLRADSPTSREPRNAMTPSTKNQHLRSTSTWHLTQRTHTPISLSAIKFCKSRAWEELPGKGAGPQQLTPSSSSMISFPMEASVVHLQLLVALTAHLLWALNLHTKKKGNHKKSGVSPWRKLEHETFKGGGELGDGGEVGGGRRQTRVKEKV